MLGAYAIKRVAAGAHPPTSIETAENNGPIFYRLEQTGGVLKTKSSFHVETLFP